MNIKEARKMMASRSSDLVELKSFVIGEAQGFIEGYEAGVKESSKLMIGACSECTDDYCLADKILALLKERKTNGHK